jgi:hypothetical protein
MMKRVESRVIGHQSIWMGFLMKIDAHAATPRVLNNMLPMMALKLGVGRMVKL